MTNNNPTATEIANYAREHGITITQAMADLQWTSDPQDGFDYPPVFS